MAQWTISDELDARLRSCLAQRGVNLNDFVEQVLSDQLDYEDDPAFRDQAISKIKEGMADANAGRVSDARQTMQRLAKKHGLDLPQ